MSKLKVNKIENTATANGGVAIDVDGHVTIDGQQLPTAGPLSNRNLIINGAMTVNQRGNFTGITDFDYRACDRFRSSFLILGTWSSEQSTDAPTGFASSLKLTCTTANAAPASNAFAKIDYYIEGQDLQHLDYGLSTAKPLTLSFWVKSNKTGSASIACFQPDNSDKLFSTTYSINSADTWEYKTINISADTAGQIDNDNGRGFQFEFWLNSGSNFIGGSTQDWAAIVNANRNSSNLGVGGAVNDYFAITGVQLEVGSKATPFEHRSYGDELARCQRYRYQIDLGDETLIQHLIMSRLEGSTGPAYAHVTFPCEMCRAPNFTFTGSTLSATGYAGDPVLNNATKSSCDIRSTRQVVANACIYLRPISQANGSDVLILNWDAEL